MIPQMTVLAYLTRSEEQLSLIPEETAIPVGFPVRT